MDQSNHDVKWRWNSVKALPETKKQTCVIQKAYDCQLQERHSSSVFAFKRWKEIWEFVSFSSQNVGFVAYLVLRLSVRPFLILSVNLKQNLFCSYVNWKQWLPTASGESISVSINVRQKIQWLYTLMLFFLYLKTLPCLPVAPSQFP